MANIMGKVGWRIVTIAVGIPVGILAKKGVERAWVAVRPGDPPRKARDPNVRWTDALAWAAISGVGVAVAELVTTKGAASVWRSLVGTEPPGTASKDIAAADDDAASEKAARPSA
jgi:hypothetical protein